jgi:hypothetical protein
VLLSLFGTFAGFSPDASRIMAVADLPNRRAGSRAPDRLSVLHIELFAH